MTPRPLQTPKLEATGSGEIRLVTYNIHQCIGSEGLEDPRRTAEIIRDLDAAAIGIQELGAYHAQPALQGMQQINALTETTGMTAIPGPTIHHPYSRYGNCLLTRECITAVRRFDISEPGCEPRGLLDVDLEMDGWGLRLMITHLGLQGWERRRQVEKILACFDARPKRSTVIMGDFNEWFPWSRALRQLHHRLYRSPYRSTFPARFPLLALDRAWISADCRLEKTRVIKTAGTRRASDHLPLEITISRSDSG
jgi:endonuclease/exonuclease/phosphatase family metal-dependent hydrolase